jgi:hypothetical protein
VKRVSAGRLPLFAVTKKPRDTLSSRCCLSTRPLPSPFSPSPYRLENEASGRAVDSLVNYETVKYFNNEAYEVRLRAAAAGCVAWDRGALRAASLAEPVGMESYLQHVNRFCATGSFLATSVPSLPPYVLPLPLPPPPGLALRRRAGETGLLLAAHTVLPLAAQLRAVRHLHRGADGGDGHGGAGRRGG